jgi:hypothetical protein
MILQNSTLTAYSKALRSCPHAGAGVHGWILSCANLGAMAGIPANQIESDVMRAMTRAPSPASEVASAIKKALAEVRTGESYTPTNAKPAKATKPKPRPNTAAAFIARGDGAEEVDWWEASPYRLDWSPGPHEAIALLETLYRPEENVFCGERYGGAANVRTVQEWIDGFNRGVPLPPHWIPNPLTGQEHPLNDGKLSRRGDSAVASFRFIVAEMDGVARADQLALWWGFRSAPLVALVDSGGKSIHAILKADVPDRATWESVVENTLFPRVLVPLGCDPACRNEARLSRLPGHYRQEKGAWQRLLYLDPKGGAR